MSTIDMDRPTEEAIVVRAKRGDRRATDELVAHHLRYVRTFANKMGRYGVPVEELVQEGTIGLLEAIPLYETSRGVRFLTFAGHRVRMHIYRAVFEFASKGMAGRGSAWGRMFFRLSRQLCQAEASAGDGADPMAVVAEAQTRYGLNVTPDQVQQIVAMQRGPLSLDYEGEDGSIRDTLQADTDAPDEDVQATREAQQAHQITYNALEQLDTREIAVMVLYDLHDEEKVSLQEVANVLGYGKETVRGVRLKAVWKVQRAAQKERKVSDVKRRILRALSVRPMSGWAIRRALRCDHTVVVAALKILLQEGAVQRRGSKITLTKHDTCAADVDFSDGRDCVGKAH